MIRNDLTVDWSSSPRIITVDAPSVEITIQDLHDSCRNMEALPANMEDRPLIASAGKEALGGGVEVGLTSTLLNAQVAFEARSGPEWVLCKISGGNLVAQDADGNGIDPRYPTAFITVDRASSSSATTQGNDAIAFMSFGNPAQVTVDVLHGFSIATFTGDQNLLGNAQYPVNNFPDAKIIATAKKIHGIEIVHSCTISVSDFSYFLIRATNHVNVQLTIEDAADVTGVRIDNTYLQGTLDGGVDVHDSIIGDINYFNGHIHDCGLGGTIILGGAIESYIASCTRLVDEIVPVIDFDNAANHLVLANYTGAVNFTNMTDPLCNAMVGLNQGAIVLNSANCTAGTVTATGLGKVMDENGDCIPPGMWNGMLIQNSLISNDSITQYVWTSNEAQQLITDVTDIKDEAVGNMLVDPIANTLTLYRTDGSEMKVYNLSIPSGEVPPYVGRVAQ